MGRGGVLFSDTKVLGTRGNSGSKVRLTDARPEEVGTHLTLLGLEKAKILLAPSPKLSKKYLKVGESGESLSLKHPFYHERL